MRSRSPLLHLLSIALCGAVSGNVHAQAPPEGSPPPSSGQTSSPSAFNPALSVVVDTLYANDSHAGGASDLIARVDESRAASAGANDPLSRGFNLREAELALSGAIDPYFDAWAILAVGPDGAAVEEAYIQTRRLPAGLTLKLGKFKSDLGYLNKQHPHQWDFTDQALPHALLLGGDLNETGLQLTWLPALPFYVLVGSEALQGTNEAIAAYAGSTPDQPLFKDHAGPRLVTGFIKVAPDLGASHALQIGISGAQAFVHQQTWQREDGDRPTDRQTPPPPADPQATPAWPMAESLEGKSRILGADLVYKYDSPRPYGRGDLTLQAEYLYRLKDLDVVGGVGGQRRFKQDGIYAQGRYGFASRWTAALRFDVFGLTNRLDQDAGLGESWGSSRRLTLALTFDPTEFSRLRLQAGRSDLEVEGARLRFNQIQLQCQVSLGAHGAHRF
jgi:hypothetical protein